MGEFRCEVIPVNSFKERVRITDKYVKLGYYVQSLGDCIYIEVKNKNKKRAYSKARTLVRN